MPRPKDSKNKPKNAQDLLDRVNNELQKQGKKLSYTIEDLADLSEVDKIAIAERMKDNPTLDIGNIFEIDSEDDENSSDDSDTYTCGHCHASLDGEDAICPHCGATLRWS